MNCVTARWTEKSLFYKGATIPDEVKEYEEPVDLDTLLDGLTLTKLNDIFQDILKRQADKTDPIRSKFGKIEKKRLRFRRNWNMFMGMQRYITDSVSGISLKSRHQGTDHLSPSWRCWS